MKVSDAFPSKFLSAADLKGRAVNVKIDSYSMEDMGEGEEKPALHFKGKQKGMILNRTNAAMIATAYGDDMDDWVGKEIELHSEKVSFRGKMVDGLRVRVQEPEPAAGDDDEPPF